MRCFAIGLLLAASLWSTGCNRSQPVGPLDQAKQLLAKDQAIAAIKLCDQALEANAEDFDALLIRGQARQQAAQLLAASEDYSRAVEIAQRSVAASDTHQTRARLADAHFFRFRLYERLAAEEGAVDDPEALQRKQRFEQARDEEYKLYVQFDPNAGLAYKNTPESLALQVRRPKPDLAQLEAEAAAAEADAKSPSDPQAQAGEQRESDDADEQVVLDEGAEPAPELNDWEKIRARQDAARKKIAAMDTTDQAGEPTLPPHEEEPAPQPRRRRRPLNMGQLGPYSQLPSLDGLPGADAGGGTGSRWQPRMGRPSATTGISATDRSLPPTQRQLPRYGAGPNGNLASQPGQGFNGPRRTTGFNANPARRQPQVTPLGFGAAFNRAGVAGRYGQEGFGQERFGQGGLGQSGFGQGGRSQGGLGQERFGEQGQSPEGAAPGRQSGGSPAGGAGNQVSMGAPITSPQIPGAAEGYTPPYLQRLRQTPQGSGRTGPLSALDRLRGPTVTMALPGTEIRSGGLQGGQQNQPAAPPSMGDFLPQPAAPTSQLPELPPL